MNKLCNTCSHWQEEHDTIDGSCEAPNCKCLEFVEITDLNDARHIEELEQDS